jgi:hypothetical protein
MEIACLQEQTPRSFLPSSADGPALIFLRHRTEFMMLKIMNGATGLFSAPPGMLAPILPLSTHPLPAPNCLLKTPFLWQN